MEGVADMIRQAREARRISQGELANRLRVAERTVRNWERGVHQPHLGQYDRIATALGFETWEKLVDSVARRGAASRHHVEGRGVPIINKTPAGEPEDYEDVGADQYDYLPIFADWLGDPDSFAVEVVGDSMVPGWQEGDIIVCSPREPVEDGDACFVQFDGSHDNGNTFKRLYKLDDERLELRPENPRHRPLIVHREAVIRCAKVIGKYEDYRRRQRG